MIRSVAFALIMAFALVVPTYAAETSNHIKNGFSPLANTVSNILDNNATTQTIIVSERQMIDQLLKDATITRKDLNDELTILSNKPETDLKKMGYTKAQIEKILSYNPGEDAYNHIFTPQGGVKAPNEATLSFRYGLGLNNTRRDVTIAYDMLWSKCPFWSFTDSFGVGWLAADKNSHRVLTKINSSSATVQYFDPKTDTLTNKYREVPMNDFSSSIVIGNPTLGEAEGDYGKHITGLTQISTQSGSYNIDTVQLFVAYGHSSLHLNVTADVSLSFNITDYAISFSPNLSVQQKIIAQGKHTFAYNNSNAVVA